MRVVISGGGTGGHIYPALAIMKEIEKQYPSSQFLYIGSENGLEAEIAKKEGIPFQSISITGFKRKLSFDNIKTILRFIKGTRDCRKMITAFKPDVVIGTGGYVSGPVVWAAAKLHIPTLIHEQNVIPGLTNTFLSRYATAVAVSFDGSASFFKKKSNVHVTGNPRATEVTNARGIEGRKSLHIPQDCKVIMIVGGSRGAKAINEAFLGMLPAIQRWKDTHFIYVTGEVHYEAMKAKLDELDYPKQQVTMKPFIYNMPDVLAGTDLIINRAGASFLAEITALGLPSILIPSPYVTNNHQEKNARWLEQTGAAKVILEHELTANTLTETIDQLLQNGEAMEQMKIASKQLGQPDAAREIVQVISRIGQSD